MLIIRRRPPRGPARRIVFGGVNFNADSPCSVEASATLRREYNTNAEWSATATIDAIARIENTARVSYDRIGPYEFVSPVHSDYPGVLESQTGISVLTDARGNVEFRAIMLADSGAIGENLSIQIINASTPTFEDIISTRIDASAAAEFLHASAFDAFARQENVGLSVSLSDSSGYIESLERTSGDSSGWLEFVSRQVTDRLAQAESSGTTSTVFDTLCRLELSAIARRDSVGVVEQLTTDRADAVSPNEIIITSRVTFDKLVPFENLAVWLREGPVPNEILQGVSSLVPAILEVLLTARRDGIAPIAVVGSATFVSDVSGPIEFLSGQQADTVSAFEFPGSVTTHYPRNILETLGRVVRDAASPAEAIASLLADFPGQIETLGLHYIPADAFGNIEIAGQSTAFPNLLLGIIEYGGGIGVDTQAAAETAAIITFPFDPGARMPIEASWLALDKTRTSISTARVRLIIAPYTAPEIWAQPFDPLAVGSLDTFGFDFTADAGQATIVSTSWTATFDPGSSGATDDTPSARCITSWAPTTLYMTNPLDDTFQTVNGVFSTAVIGTFPASAVGGTYNIYVQVLFSDTRSLLVTTKMLCVSAES